MRWVVSLGVKLGAHSRLNGDGVSSSNELEVYKQHMAAKQKYAYFMLAAVGACIGFALTQTKDLAYSPSQVPLIIAVAMWGLSFWCGCRHLTQIQFGLYANVGLIRLQAGKDPVAGHDPSLKALGNKAIRDIAEKHFEKSGNAISWQPRFFIAGAIAYIFWHASEMIARMPV